MSSLIDTMITGGSNVRGRVVRQTATYISFSLVYLPSWLAIGVVISALVLPVHSNGLPVGFVILSGLSFAGFSLFGASFFKKAQLSGSIMVVIALVAAILPAVLVKQTSVACGILSFLFPSANFTYFITGIATFEAADKPVSMMHRANDTMEQDRWRLPLYIHWIFLIVHLLAFPALAFVVEHVLFSTASPHRRFAPPAKMGDPTVTISGFHKT
jgi:ATP-binding cassette subfamily A (ABC1) protein 3